MLMKWGMSWNEKPTFSAEEVAGLRIFFASVFLIPLLYKHFKAFNFKKYGLPVFGMGMFGNFIPAFLFTAAETKINSSLAGMLNALTPLFTILISVFIFRVKSSRVQLYGVTLGFVGAVMLMYFNGEQTNSTTTMGYSGLVVLATLCYAISVNIIRRYLSDLSSITAAVFAFAQYLPFAEESPCLNGSRIAWAASNFARRRKQVIVQAPLTCTLGRCQQRAVGSNPPLRCAPHHLGVLAQNRRRGDGRRPNATSL
mgnify:CR=1 FL=1